MKKLFQALDGKIFEDEILANEYEQGLLLESRGRIKILENLDVFKNFKDGDIVEAACNFDGAGNWSKQEKLEGSKARILEHLAVNRKYWNIGNRVEVEIWKNDIIKL